VRGLQEPQYVDLSDRRGKASPLSSPFDSNLTAKSGAGGRTAWSTMVTVNGMNFQARFWYDGTYLPQAKEDCSEIALRALTGCTNATQAPPPASHYRTLGNHRDQVVPSG